MASKEYTLKYLQKRIRDNKRQKGFPLDNVELDLAYLIEEMGEMARALRRGWHEDFVKELVDVLILSLGLLEMKKVDGYRGIVKKMLINEKRQYRRVGKYDLPSSEKEGVELELPEKRLTIKEIQKRIWQNKLKKRFNTTVPEKEVVHLLEELGELVRAHRKGKKSDFIDALVDIIIYGLGIFEMYKKDGYELIFSKMKQNERRRYSKKGKYLLRPDQLSE